MRTIDWIVGAMLVCGGLILGISITIGVAAYVDHRRAVQLRSARPICECGDIFGVHDRDGACHAMKRVPSDYGGKVTKRCLCRMYVGPPPPMVLPPVLSLEDMGF